MNRLPALIRQPWSAVDFDKPEQTEFARSYLAVEARSGLQTLSTLFAVPLSIAAVSAAPIGLPPEYSYVFLALAGLAVHIHFSSRAVDDVRALHLLGMALLVVSGAAFVLIAHRTGSLDPVLFASVGFLFMVIPAMPWGLREAAIVSAMIYGLFTASTWSLADRFDGRSLWGLQIYMLAAALVSTTLVARTVLIRKHDLITRFQLDRARRELEVLSLQDALTGIWNRRYLDAEFPTWSSAAGRKHQPVWFALVDLDHFKSLNDRHGHVHGDRVLGWVARSLEGAVDMGGFAARVGGDEFACIIAEEDGLAAMQVAVEAFSRCANKTEGDDRETPTFSAGLVLLPNDRECKLEEVYKSADNALYEAKRMRTAGDRTCRVVASELGCPVSECA